MSFEFIAPDAAQPVNGTRPALRSPIEWALRDQGANFTERAGWRMVTDYGNPSAELAACRDSVGVADLSFLGKLELQADPGIVSGIVAELTHGGALAPGQARLHEEVWWCPLTLGRVLVLAPPERTAELRELVEAAASTAPFASVIEMTAAYGSNALVGPLARESFARTMALDLRPDHFAEGGFAPVSVARTPGMVLHQGPDLFLHLFGAGFAYYVWTVFVDAARHLGGRAVGTTALRARTTAEEGVHA
jgi:glycine cleavage system aminomethyltransferase T